MMLIQPSILSQYTVNDRALIHNAFAILSQLGVWQRHVEFEQKKMIDGSESEDLGALAARILEGRKRVILLAELQALGLKPQVRN